MAQQETYAFRPATTRDLDLLRTWRRRPHMREWRDDEDPFDEDDLGDARVALWIVERDERPFAFMQDDDVHGWTPHHLGGLPPGSRGVDQFIGEPDMLGRGHGAAFIAQRLRTLFEDGAPSVGTGPHPDNARAIAVYRKLGFKHFAPAQVTERGLVTPMRADPS